MKEERFLNIIKEIIPESTDYIGDDTAYIPEKDLVLTQDTLVENIHFKLKTISPFYLGRKAVSVNLSDIAASGCVPLYILISLSMPKNINESFVKEFYKGVNSICKEYGVLVIGGDLTAAEKITISICAIGSGNGLTPACRKNAKDGDVVIVTGNFGSSAAGLFLLEDFHKKKFVSNKIQTKFIKSHINPVPRINEGRKILEIASKPAMMDSSDGLADALYKICLMSDVCMEISFDDIPYDPDILNIFDDFETVKKQILLGGEDYELVAAVSKNAYEKIKKEISVKKIGIVKKTKNNNHAYINFNDNKINITSDFLNTAFFKHFE